MTAPASKSGGATRPAWHAAWLRPAAAAAACLPVALWVFYEAQRVFRADSASLAERHQLLQWASGAAAPKSQQEWQNVYQALQRSLDITPRDPELQERLGDLYLVAGQHAGADAEAGRQHYAKAASSYEHALTLRPSAPQAWAMLAAARQAMGAPAAVVHETWARARALGPYEGHVQPVLMQVVLADWNGASPEMRAWAEALFDQGTPAARRDINAMAARYGLKFEPDAAEAR